MLKWDALCSGTDETGLDDARELGDLSVAEDLPVAGVEGVDDGDDFRVLFEVLSLFYGYERPELVDVDCGSPVLVSGEVEVAHTDLTEVTRMVFVEVRSAGEYVSERNGRRGVGIRTCGGGHHLRDRDHLGACGAFQLDRDRLRRVRGASVFLRIWTAF